MAIAVDIEAGTVQINGATVTVGADTIGISDGDATDPRFDLVVCDDAGVVTVVEGTPDPNPAYPAIPADSVVLAAVYVPEDATELTIDNVGDKRVVVEPKNMVATVAGNTAGALAAISTGTIRFAGGNNITISQSANSLTFSGPNTHAQQTAISGIANSETTYTSGTVGWSVVGGPATIRSTTGNQFQLSVAAQSVQAETQTFVGGLKNTETTYTSGTVELEGTNNVTVFSTTGQRFRISGANTHAQQTGISGLSNSETQYTSGTVNLSGLGAVIVRSTTGNAFQISAPTQSVQAETQTFLGAISNSETTYTSGTIGLSVVGGALTIRSTTGNAFQFSAPAGGGGATVSMYPDFPQGVVLSSTIYSGSTSQGAGGASTNSATTLSAHIFPIPMRADIQANNVRIAGQFSINTASSNSNNAFRAGGTLGIYTRTGNTLSSVTSWSYSLSYSQNSTSYRATYGYGGSSATVSTQASANSAVVIAPLTGTKFFPMNWSTNTVTFTGGQYFGVLAHSISTISNSLVTMSLGLLSTSAAQMISEIGDPVANVTTPWPLLGQLSVTMSSNTTLAGGSGYPFPASIGVTNLTTTIASGNSNTLNNWPFLQIITRSD